MGKKQTRRSISVRGVTYEKLRAYCAEVDLSLSDFVEQRIAEFFAAHPEARAAAARPQLAPMVPQPAPVVQAPRVAVARTEKSVPPVRSVPAQSQLVKKPLPTAALRVAAPVRPQTSDAAGRPKPTPVARELRVRAPEDRSDYRALRF